MKITAKLFATLRDYAPPGAAGRSFEQDVSPNVTVGNMLDKWSVPENVTLLIFVNSVHADRNHVLNEGDILAVFPPIAGG